MSAQDWIAWAIALGAAFFLVRRLFGWPRRRATTTPVKLGSRLERGLKKKR